MQPRSVTVRRLMTPVLALAAAVLLAACGSSSDSTSTDKTTTTTAANAAGPTKTVVVKTADDPSLGTILVDADGKTLYTLTNGTVAVACTGGCLTAWPPALLPAGTTTATGSAGVTKLGTTPSGTDLQVTHDGLPLYRFAADTAAGDANGDGISSFGGTWHVVKISGAASDNSTSTTKKSSSGY